VLAKPMHHPTNNELDAYLNAPVEDIDDALKWWQQQCATYPHLLHMVLDYLTIPGMYICILIYHSLIVFAATSVDVEHVFSCGRLLLSHICS
jgi:hypothetical protein